MLRGSASGARKSHPNLPCCACADRLQRLHCIPGKGTLLLHLPPPLAWAGAKACLVANTARPLKRRSHLLALALQREREQHQIQVTQEPAGKGPRVIRSPGTVIDRKYPGASTSSGTIDLDQLRQLGL